MTNSQAAGWWDAVLALQDLAKPIHTIFTLHQSGITNPDSLTWGRSEVTPSTLAPTWPQNHEPILPLLSLNYTLPIFHDIFAVFHSTPTSFLSRFLFHFITELELQLYSIFSPCSWLACSQVRTQPFYSFTVWLASIFSSALSTKFLVSSCCAMKC